MEGQDRVYGSDELTPEIIRGAQFEVRANGYAPDQVHELLEQVATAMQVLQGESGPAAIRAELQRVSESTARIVMAAQEAAERLREQGAIDARAIVEDTRKVADDLRERAYENAALSQQHVGELRDGFVNELRDMYDRIGAALYRFERNTFAGEEIAQAAAPAMSTEHDDISAGGTAFNYAEAAPLATDTAAASSYLAPPDPDPAHIDLPIVGDEPLVDLRGMAGHPANAPTEQRHAPLSMEPLEPPLLEHPQVPPADPIPPAVPVEAVEPPPPPSMEMPPFAEPAADAGGDGGWLMSPDAAVVEQAAQPYEQAPTTAPEPPPLPQPPSLAAEGQTAGGMQVDYEAVRLFVLQSMNEGSPREAIERYLHQHMGVEDPRSMIDRIMAEGLREG